MLKQLNVVCRRNAGDAIEKKHVDSEVFIVLNAGHVLGHIERVGNQCVLFRNERGETREVGVFDTLKACKERVQRDLKKVLSTEFETVLRRHHNDVRKTVSYFDLNDDDIEMLFGWARTDSDERPKDVVRNAFGIVWKP